MSFTMKHCTCASITFLAGVMSWSLDSMSSHIPQGSRWEVCESSCWKCNGRKLFFRQNWWSVENLQNSVINYASGCWISYDPQILGFGLKNAYFKCNVLCPLVPKVTTANRLEFAVQMSTVLSSYLRSHLLCVFTFAVKPVGSIFDVFNFLTDFCVLYSIFLPIKP